MATIIKRGGSWRAQLCINRVRESATFDTRREAVAWAQQREAELTGKRLPDRTLADGSAWTRWRTSDAQAAIVPAIGESPTMSSSACGWRWGGWRAK